MSTTIGRVGFTVDAWDPAYAAALTVEALAELGTTSAKLELDVETPASAWRPISPARTATPPKELLIADGVRRVDARVWIHDPGAAMPAPGIAASYAAGIVRCVPGGPAVLAAIEVGRSLFSASPHATDVTTPAATYRATGAPGGTVEELSLALQQQVTRLEVDLAVEYRRASAGGEDLLLVDGPLRGRTHLPRTVGYIKTHHTSYLPPQQAGVVAALAVGQRTPVFLMGTSWRRHAWYAKLPDRSASPWAGIVRCEAGADLPVEEVVALADTVTLALPALAGVDYKDPRAPQNLVPIGGLERLLRHRLGDPALLYRSLRAAAGRDQTG